MAHTVKISVPLVGVGLGRRVAMFIYLLVLLLSLPVDSLRLPDFRHSDLVNT